MQEWFEQTLVEHFNEVLVEGLLEGGPQLVTLVEDFGFVLFDETLDCVGVGNGFLC